MTMLYQNTIVVNCGPLAARCRRGNCMNYQLSWHRRLFWHISFPVSGDFQMLTKPQVLVYLTKAANSRSKPWSSTVFWKDSMAGGTGLGSDVQPLAVVVSSVYRSTTRFPNGIGYSLSSSFYEVHGPTIGWARTLWIFILMGLSENKAPQEKYVIYQHFTNHIGYLRDICGYTSFISRPKGVFGLLWGNIDLKPSAVSMFFPWKPSNFKQDPAFVHPTWIWIDISHLFSTNLQPEQSILVEPHLF